MAGRFCLVRARDVRNMTVNADNANIQAQGDVTLVDAKRVNKLEVTARNLRVGTERFNQDPEPPTPPPQPPHQQPPHQQPPPPQRTHQQSPSSVSYQESGSPEASATLHYSRPCSDVVEEEDNVVDEHRSSFTDDSNTDQKLHEEREGEIFLKLQYGEKEPISDYFRENLTIRDVMERIKKISENHQIFDFVMIYEDEFGKETPYKDFDSTLKEAGLEHNMELYTSFT